MISILSSRFALTLVIAATCTVLVAAATTEADYTRQFRQDNPQLTHWSDDSILDEYVAKFGTSDPVLARHAKTREQQRALREKEAARQLAIDNTWEVRSILPWEKPPLSVVFSRKRMSWQGTTQLWPVVVISNQSKRPISAIEVMFKIDGVLSRRLVCETIAPAESLSFVSFDLFGKQWMFDRKVRFICAGYRGSIDEVVEFPDG